MRKIKQFSKFINEDFGSEEMPNQFYSQEMGQDIPMHAADYTGNHPQDDAEYENYMFFGNLKTIKRLIDILLAMDPKKVNDTLSNGHAWADDHIATSKDDIEEVADFLMNEMESSKSSLIHEKPIQIEEDASGEEVVDVRATLKNLQAKAEAKDEMGNRLHKVEVELEDGETKTVFRMPMINLMTFVGGGRLQIPMNEDGMLEVLDLIKVDENPVKIIMKPKPAPQKRYEPSPEEREQSRREWEERWGPGGGPMTFWGRRTD